MVHVELHFGGTTDVGRVREVNEDAFLASPPIFVVADGMGGHHAGDVASRIVVEEFGDLEALSWDARGAAAEIGERLAESQRRILEYAGQHGAGDSATWYSGTTAVTAMVVEDEGAPHWLVANLGDSRAYRLSGDELEQVSVDHSLVQELVDAGRLAVEDIATHPERHVITRALGGPEVPRPDFFLLPLGTAERVLLCSDGVTGMLADDELSDILRAHPDAATAADRVVAAAVAAGGLDNATAVVVDVVGWERSDSREATPHQARLDEKRGARP